MLKTSTGCRLKVNGLPKIKATLGTVFLRIVTYDTNGKRTKVHPGVQIEYGEVSISNGNVLWHLEMGKLPKKTIHFENCCHQVGVDSVCVL